MEAEDSKDKTGERLALGVVALFCYGFGWLDLWQGGISLRSKQGNVGFVDGVTGLAVAGGLMLVAALCFFMLARSYSMRSSNIRWLLAVLLLLPVCYYNWR